MVRYYLLLLLVGSLPLNAMHSDKKRVRPAASFQSVDPLPKRAKFPERINHCGLANLGNSCYINTMIQLLATTSLGEIIPGDTTDEVIGALKALLGYFVPGADQKNLSSDLSRCVTLMRKLMIDEEQGAPKEPVATSLWHRFFALFSSDPLSSSSVLMRQQDVGELLNRVFMRFQGTPLSQQIEDLFYLQYHQVYRQAAAPLVCNYCGVAKEQSAPEKMFPLIIPGRAYLQEALYDYGHAILNEVRCGVCATAWPQIDEVMQITHYPEYLFIQVRRVDQQALSFPLSNLKLSLEQEHGYNLVGIGNHRGTQNAGHYWATIRKNDGWYSISDDTQPVKLTHTSWNAMMHEGTPYFFVYRRTDRDNLDQALVASQSLAVERPAVISAEQDRLSGYQAFITTLLNLMVVHRNQPLTVSDQDNEQLIAACQASLMSQGIESTTLTPQVLQQLIEAVRSPDSSLYQAFQECGITELSGANRMVVETYSSIASSRLSAHEQALFTSLDRNTDAHGLITRLDGSHWFVILIIREKNKNLFSLFDPLNRLCDTQKKFIKKLLNKRINCFLTV